MAKLNVNIVEKFPQEKFTTVKVPFSNYDENVSCLYVPIPREANLATIDNTLHHLPITAKSPNIIVFRFHSPELVRLEEEGHILQLKLVGKRFKKSSIYFLTWNSNTQEYNLELQGVGSSEDIQIDDQQLIKEIRHAELYSIVNKPDIILNEDDDYHYIFSNGNHYKKFLRLGNAFYSKDVLDSFSFWLLPYLQSEPLILLDSSSIISLGLNLIHYCHDCNELTDSNWYGNVECLTDYFEPDEDILIKLSKRLRNANSPNTILNIFSAKGTGRLYNRVKEICSDLDLRIIKNVTLFSANTNDRDSNEEIFCHLDEGFIGFSTEKKCPSCQNNSVGIKIDERTYTLDLQATLKPVSLNLKAIRPTSDFFKKYHNTNCFSIHRNQHDGLRHHMIHMDLNELLEHPKFHSRLVKTTEKFKNNVDCVICPEHEAAQKIADIVVNVLHVPCIQSDHNKLKNLNHDERNILEKSKNILLVDDVLITGTRLNEYKELLDRAGITSEYTVIKFLVGVARTETEEELKGIMDYVFPHTNFACVEKLLLPNWDKDLCPWCWEERQLSNSDGKLDYDEYLSERHKRLKNKKEGIKEDIFLQWEREPMLKHGAKYTVFGNTQDEVEIFVAISSVIQNMRSSKILNEVNSPSKLSAKVYDLNKYFKGRFYEDFIRACILRASQKKDIQSSRNKHKLQDVIYKLIYEKEHSSVFIPELIFNISQGKLPSVDIEKNLLDNKNPGIKSFLSILLKD